ncbi:MAG: hypothetical protein KGO81_01220 [Bacteroidota bacterium]|nr:hypothetical protein [Bacteroidota bacterium]
MSMVFLTPDELKRFIIEAVNDAFKNELSIIPAQNPNEIVTLEKAEEILHLSRHTIKKYVRLGLLQKALPNVKGYRFYIKDLHAFASQYRN